MAGVIVGLGSPKFSNPAVIVPQKNKDSTSLGVKRSIQPNALHHTNAFNHNKFSVLISDVKEFLTVLFLIDCNLS